MIKTATVAFAACSAFALSVALTAACGSGHKDGPSPSAGLAQKLFHFHRQEAYKSLDPHKQFDSASGELVGNVYSSLLQYHYLKRPYELAPDLVTKLPELRADGLSYSFELRDDVFFHDDPCFPGGKGRKLTSDDVIYSLQRFADANVNILSYVLLQSVIEGMDAFREQTAKLGKATRYDQLPIAGVTKLDARHFAIKLTRPTPLALYPFAAPQVAIVAREAVEKYGQDFESHPVGTGPFVMTRSDRRGTVVLEHYARYHDSYPTAGATGDAEAGLLANAGKRMPFLDRIELPLIEEHQPAMLKFLSGQLDWVSIDRDNFTKLAYKDATGFHLKPEQAGKFTLYAEPDLRADYFLFNMKDPVVGKNKALRQAFAYALNPGAFLEQMLNGRGELLTSIVPIQIAGSQKDLSSDWYKPNLELAKQKLAEAGYPNGKGLPPIVLEERASTSQTRQQFEFIRAKLARANITVQASFQTFSAFLKRIEAGNFQVTEEAWGADYPDAENFYQLLYSKNKAPGPNHGGYDNPEYDRLYEQIRGIPNSPERFALFAKMNAIIKEDLPLLFTFNLYRVGMYQNWVHGFKRNVMMEMPFKYLDIDIAAKAKGRK